MPWPTYQFVRDDTDLLHLIGEGKLTLCGQDASPWQRVRMGAPDDDCCTRCWGAGEQPDC